MPIFGCTEEVGTHFERLWPLDIKVLLSISASRANTWGRKGFAQKMCPLVRAQSNAGDPADKGNTGFYLTGPPAGLWIPGRNALPGSSNMVAHSQRVNITRLSSDLFVLWTENMADVLKPLVRNTNKSIKEIIFIANLRLSPSSYSCHFSVIPFPLFSTVNFESLIPGSAPA